MSTAILDLDRTQLLEKNKAIKTDSRSIPSLETDLLESIDLSISANFLNNTLVSSTNNRNESLVKTDTVTNTDITLTSNLGSDKFETASTSLNNSLVPGISTQTEGLVNNQFENITDQAFFGNLFQQSVTIAINPKVPGPGRITTLQSSGAARTRPIVGEQTTFGHRVDPNAGYVGGFYNITLIFRSVASDPQGGGLIDLKPPVERRALGNISPLLTGPNINDYNTTTVNGRYNLVESTGGTGTGFIDDPFGLGRTDKLSISPFSISIPQLP